MSLIPFPDVPNVPGVPAVFRSLTVPTPGQLLNNLLGGVAEAIFGSVVWGVFDQSGKTALTPDSFLDIDYKQDMRVSNYPQEAGAFASYNKVGTPYDCRVRMALGGDKASRTAFLAQLDTMLKAIDLFTVVTPEATYVNAALQNYNYRRETKNGATMLIVDLWFIEVRLTGVATFSQPVAAPAAAPVPDALPAPTSGAVSGADPVSSGQVQSAPAPAKVIKAVIKTSRNTGGATGSWGVPNTGGATGSWAPNTGGATGSW